MDDMSVCIVYFDPKIVKEDIERQVRNSAKRSKHQKLQALEFSRVKAP